LPIDPRAGIEWGTSDGNPGGNGEARGAVSGAWGWVVRFGGVGKDQRRVVFRWAGGPSGRHLRGEPSFYGTGNLKGGGPGGRGGRFVVRAQGTCEPAARARFGGGGGTCGFPQKHKEKQTPLARRGWVKGEAGVRRRGAGFFGQRMCSGGQTSGPLRGGGDPGGQTGWRWRPTRVVELVPNNRGFVNGLRGGLKGPVAGTSGWVRRGGCLGLGRCLCPAAFAGSSWGAPAGVFWPVGR